jgi:hypothetical protein
VKNYPLIRKTWEHILAHPEEHDQHTWGLATACGTTMCFAGQAVVLNGDEPIWEVFPPDTIMNSSRSDEQQMVSVRLKKDGSRYAVSDAAAIVLGLDADEAERLFMDCTNIEEVSEVVNEYLAEEANDASVE